MYKNYLKIAWRNITGQKGFSLINILGLSVGMAASVMLLMYVKYESGFDHFHKDGDKIYRVISYFGEDKSHVFARTLHKVGEVAKEQSPLVSDFIRMKPERHSIRHGDAEYEHENILMTDPNFLDFFSFDVKEGNVEKALSDPSSIVLTYELSQKLFGDQSPLDKTIYVTKNHYDFEINRKSSVYHPVKVGAILKPLPLNTHIRFDALLSFEAFEPSWLITFANDVFVYLKTDKVLLPEEEENISSITESYVAGLFSEGYRYWFNHSLQHLKDIHFGPKYGYDMGPKGNIELIYVFYIVAAFILFIAIINFINLVTARSEGRAIEAGIRKISGANRKDIILQFLGESILVSFISFLIALLFVEFCIEPFSNLLGRKSDINVYDNIYLLARISVLALLVGVVAGIYPALVFSKFQPAEILKGKARGGKKNPLLRIILVVVQFAISVFLIVSITVFNRQIDYMKTADMGFDSDNILVFSDLSEGIINGYEAIRAELLQEPGITNATSSQAIPGRGGSGMTIRGTEDPASADVSVREFRVGRGFKETYGLQMVQGHWFDFDMKTDLENFVVNETAVKAMGANDPVGTDVILQNRLKGKIIGVVRDFHVSSLKHEIVPMVISAYSQAFYIISVKISPDRKEQALNHIENVFYGFDPNYRLTEQYINNYFENFYQQEENNNKILNYASVIAVVIAMLGLLGLSSYIISARKKEIGIRKIFGASTIQITAVLFRDITRWVILANLIAWPAAWYAMSLWLEGFPYRIDVSIWYLINAGCISLVIAILTISWQTLKASVSNPVNVIKVS